MSWDGAAHANWSALHHAPLFLLWLHPPSLRYCHFPGHMAHFQLTFMSTEGISHLHNVSRDMYSGAVNSVPHQNFIANSEHGKHPGNKRVPQAVWEKHSPLHQCKFFQGFFSYKACRKLNHCFLSKSKFLLAAFHRCSISSLLTSAGRRCVGCWGEVPPRLKDICRHMSLVSALPSQFHQGGGRC